ncbi:MAG: hypothetical protein HOP23_03635 [Methylococcaceae bacterium]|nr:hypothetical protein [Methylococcaceae bacterium]
MLATHESRQQLVAELIEHSAQIDQLVVLSRQQSTESKFEYYRDLEDLRAKQREITRQLHASEESGSNTWENIGNGG